MSPSRSSSTTSSRASARSSHRPPRKYALARNPRAAGPVPLGRRAAPGSSSLGPSWDRDGPPARGRSLRRPRRRSPRSSCHPRLGALAPVIQIPFDPNVHIGPITLAWHGIFTAVGIFFGVWLPLRLLRGKINEEDGWAVATWGVVGGI